MLAQRDHRGHTWTTDEPELPSPPARVVDPDDRDPRDVLEEARVVAGPEEFRTDGGEEWDPEPAALREGETTDERTHAARNAENLAMYDIDPDDSETEELAPIHVGDHVTITDRDPTVVVKERLEESAGEHYVERIDETVAEYNDCHPDEDVFKVVFPGRDDDDLSDLQPYPYPRSMLTVEASIHDLEGDEEVSE